MADGCLKATCGALRRRAADASAAKFFYETRLLNTTARTSSLTSPSAVRAMAPLAAMKKASSSALENRGTVPRSAVRKKSSTAMDTYKRTYAEVVKVQEIPSRVSTNANGDKGQ
jgi:hypothetical protein